VVVLGLSGGSTGGDCFIFKNDGNRMVVMAYLNRLSWLAWFDVVFYVAVVCVSEWLAACLLDTFRLTLGLRNGWRVLL